MDEGGLDARGSGGCRRVRWRGRYRPVVEQCADDKGAVGHAKIGVVGSGNCRESMLCRVEEGAGSPTKRSRCDVPSICDLACADHARKHGEVQHRLVAPQDCECEQPTVRHYQVWAISKCLQSCFI
jgi:hypothetical protein